jgi:hypothetical protein
MHQNYVIIELLNKGEIKMNLSKIIWWVRHRTTDVFHKVHTGMEPGYSDTSERMLCVNFNLLKEFVEIEKASFYSGSFNYPIPNAGVAQLIFEIKYGKNTTDLMLRSQSKNTKEIYALYDWWVNKRPIRIEYADIEWNKYEKFGKEIYKDFDVFKTDKDTPELKSLYKIWVEKSREIEEKNIQEDEDMSIRLMRVRESLWT